MAQPLHRIAAAGPLGGAAVPAHRVRRLARLLEVVGEERRVLVELLGTLRLDGARHRRVGAPAPLA